MNESGVSEVSTVSDLSGVLKALFTGIVTLIVCLKVTAVSSFTVVSDEADVYLFPPQPLISMDTKITATKIFESNLYFIFCSP